MPEDLRDRLVDFDLMLEGFVKLAWGGTVCESYNSRLLEYWDDLSTQLDKVLKEKEKKK